MRSAILSVFSLAAFAPNAFAALYMTNPVITTTAQGGQVLTIQWQDSPSPPTLADIGPCEVGLYAGNVQQQTELQPISPSLDVSKQASQNFTINANAGPNSNAYFIRFSSLALKDSNNTAYPYQAFSAQFALTNMTGQFNSTVQAQVNGITTPPAPASTPATSTPASSSAVKAAATVTSNSGTKPTSSSSSAAQSTQTGAALVTRSNMGVMGIVAVLVGLFM